MLFEQTAMLSNGRKGKNIAWHCTDSSHIILADCDVSLYVRSTSMEDAQDAEATAHAALHYFYEAVMPFLEVSNLF
jgi:hypothetical protein